MKFLTKKDWESFLGRLYLNKNKSAGRNWGVRSEKIEILFFEISKIIEEICKSKNLNHTSFGIAMTFVHYYACFYDYRTIEKYELAFACFYMSTKVQFNFIKLPELIEECQNFINKNNPVNEQEKDKKKDLDLIKYEIQVYSLLGYDLDIETPYQMYYYNLKNLQDKFQILKNSDNLEKMKTFCFNLITDTYTRPLSIYYHPKIIYLSCLIFTFKFLEFNECNIEKLVENENVDLIAECMENINDIYAKYVENS